MRDHTQLELEVAGLIVETLNLDSMEPAEINPEEPLFGEGLGLDSIDALELALMVKQTYGIDLKSGDEGNAQIFSSLASLSEFVEKNRVS